LIQAAPRVNRNSRIFSIKREPCMTHA